MKKISGLLVLLCALVFASCDNGEEALEVNNNKTFHFSINANLEEFENSDATRAYGEYVVRLKWKQGDALSVVNLSTKKLLGGTLKAAADGSTTTFEGELKGNIGEGDKLMFITPAVSNNAEEVDWERSTIDLSKQDGSASTKVPIAAYAVENSASGMQSGAYAPGKTYSFNFLMAYLYFGFSGLPKNAVIDKVVFEGVPSNVSLSYANEQVKVEEGDFSSIEMSLAANLKTSANGNRAYYIAIPNALPNDNRYISFYINGSIYKVKFSSALIERSMNYRTLISGFKRVETPLAFSAAFPQSMPKADASDKFDTERSWKVGEAVSVVNLTTGEVLKNPLTITATSDVAVGTEATFTGSVFGNEGVNDGDKLLLLYPAIGNEYAAEFKSSPVIYDIFDQQKGSLADVPVVLAAEATYTTATGLSLTKQFTHISSIVEMRANFEGVAVEGSGLSNNESTTVSTQSGTGDIEGFGTEKGSWGAGFSFSVASIELQHLPSAIMISSDGNSSYKVSTLNNGKKILVKKSDDTPVATVEENIASPVFVSVPAASEDGVLNSVAVAYHNEEGGVFNLAQKQWTLSQGKYFSWDF